MNEINDPNTTSRWLTIEGGEARKVFVFRASDEHTIVVGAGAGVHYQVRDAAPLCFYVERAGPQLYLVPAYVGHLRLNSHKVTERTALPDSGIVEFGSHRLHLTVQQVPPHEDDVTVMLPFEPSTRTTGVAQCDEAMATRIAEFEPSSDENDAPTAALEVQASPPEAHDTEVVELAPTQEQEVQRWLQRPPSASEAGSSPGPVLEDDDPALATQVMGSVSDFDDAFPNYEEIEPLRAGPNEATPATYGRKEPSKGALTSPSPSESAPNPTDTGTERTEGIPFDDFVPPTGKSKAAQASRKEEPVREDVASSAPAAQAGKKSAPPGRSVLASLTWGMERFGQWAKEKPALAMGGSVATALLIGLSIGGITKLVSTPQETEAPPTSTVLATDDASPPGQAAEDTKVASAKVEEAKAAPKAEANAGESPETKELSPEDAEAAAEAKAAEEKAHAEQVNRAVEHLVAGRDDEAAHAYQSIAQTKYATEQLTRMAELLQKRQQARHDEKSATYQAPELYR